MVLSFSNKTILIDYWAGCSDTVFNWGCNRRRLCTRPPWITNPGCRYWCKVRYTFTILISLTNLCLTLDLLASGWRGLCPSSIILSMLKLEKILSCVPFFIDFATFFVVQSQLYLFLMDRNEQCTSATGVLSPSLFGLHSCFRTL